MANNIITQFDSFLRKPNVLLNYNSKKKELARFKKAFIDIVVNPVMYYNIQTSFKIEGYFTIKVTPLGVNLCLLEECEEGEIRDLLREYRS